MKIRIKSEEYNFFIPLPNCLLNEKIISWAIKQGKKHTTELNDIPTEYITRLLHELKQSIKTFGHYELVYVESSDGDIVIVEL